jgi:hypothetical protein
VSNPNLSLEGHRHSLPVSTSSAPATSATRAALVATSFTAARARRATSPTDQARPVRCWAIPGHARVLLRARRRRRCSRRRLREPPEGQLGSPYSHHGYPLIL